MKISVVTISFNQAEFLEDCLKSVAAQEGPWEHIIVDPGSTDGSREIIEHRWDQFSHIIFEPDEGPADGLNRGFSKATGEIYFFLNSDDIVLPNAFDNMRQYFSAHPSADVVSGHGFVIDAKGERQRRVWSDRPSRIEFALGTAILIQPSTYFRASAFHSVGGFNAHNKSNWDGELFVDMLLKEQKFDILDSFMSGYRIHQRSITGTGSHDNLIYFYGRSRYRKIMGREMGMTAQIVRQMYRLKRLLMRPQILVERVLRGGVYGKV